MSPRSHEVGLLILLLSTFQSWQYFPIVFLIVAYKIYLRRGCIPKGPVYTLMPILLMVACGVVFAGTNTNYEVLKDLWYVLKIAIIVMLGILIGFAESPDPRWLRITAIYAAIALILEIILYSVTSVSSQTFGFIPPFAPVFAVIVYIRSASSQLTKYRTLKWMLTFLILAVLVLTQSRTTWVISVVTWVGAGGTFRSKAKMALSAAALAAAVMVTAPLLPQFDAQNITFLGKIQNSLTELSFTTDYDMSQITTNWRGFEAARAYETWRTGSVGQQIFGHGMGAATDIGFYYDLSEDYSVRYLPILHNGYLMVLVKYGILGVALFVAFMASPFFLFTRTDDLHTKLVQNIGLTASVILLVTTASITGPLNISSLDGITLFMGWGIGQHFQMRITHSKQGRKPMEKIAPTRVSEAPSHLRCNE